MPRPASRVQARNADCPHCGARVVHHGPKGDPACPRAGCPGPRRHPLALLFVAPRPAPGK